MRNIEDAAAIGTLLDGESFTAVTISVEVTVANERHVFLFD
jgi:hypothetical protein